MDGITELAKHIRDRDNPSPYVIESTDHTLVDGLHYDKLRFRKIL